MFHLAHKCCLLLLLFAVSTTKADEVSDWLKQMGCDSLLALHLEEQLLSSALGDKTKIAAELANLYAFMLGKTTDGSEEDILVRVNSMIESMPDVMTTDLELQLLRASYLSSELLLEKYRLRIISEEKAGDAIKTLRGTAKRLSSIRASLLRKLNHSKTFSERDSNRLGLATSLNAWASYYLAWYTKDVGLAAEAAELFASILEAEKALLNEVSLDLRQEEYGARALLGIALSKSISKGHSVSKRWFEELKDESTWDGVKHQRLAWEIAVDVDHQQWSDLSALNFEQISKPNVLRLIAVHGFEQRADEDAKKASKSAINQLINNSELSVVSQIVTKYNIQSPTISSFVESYIQGEFEYRNLKAKYSDDEISSDSKIQGEFHDISSLFKKALQSSDADKYPLIKDDCAYLLGISQFYAGKFIDAGNTFYALGKKTNSEKVLWMALVSFDSIDEANLIQRKTMQEVAERYYALWPNSDKATQLKLRFERNDSSLSAIEDLLKVQPADPSYTKAQEEASQKLYQAWSSSKNQDKAKIGNQYVGVTLSLIFSDREDNSENTPERTAMQSLRVLEVALDPRVKRLVAAKKVLELIGQISNELTSLKSFENEITYRNIAYLLLNGQFDSAIQEALTAIENSPTDSWTKLSANLTWDIAVQNISSYTEFETQFNLGMYLLSNLTDVESKTARYHLIATKVVRAGLLIYSDQPNLNGGKDAPHLLDVLAIARRLVELYPRNKICLELAAESEAAFGDSNKAIKYWGIIVDSTERNSVDWLRAKYQLIELMAKENQEKAVAILDQHQLLYPSYGIEPYGSKLKNLHNQLRGVSDGS